MVHPGGLHESFFGSVVRHEFGRVRLAISNRLQYRFQRHFAVTRNLLGRARIFLPRILAVERARRNPLVLNEQLPVGRLGLRRQIFVARGFTHGISPNQAFSHFTTDIARRKTHSLQKSNVCPSSSIISGPGVWTESLRHEIAAKGKEPQVLRRKTKTGTIWAGWAEKK